MYSTNAYGFCKEDLNLIENFEKANIDTVETWVCHHRLETHDKEGNLRSKELSKKNFIENDIYYHRPSNELIFLTPSEHMKVHCSVKSRKEQLSLTAKTHLKEYSNNSEALKKFYKEHPEAKLAHSQRMKKRFENPEERQKVSEQQKKNYEEHPERKQRHSEYMKQYYEDRPELKESISQRMTELSKDSEFIQKVSQGVRRHYEEHPEARQAMSDRLKGRKYTEEERQAHQQQYENMRNDPKRKELGRQLGESNKGKIHDEEYKQKMSESCKKVVHTQEWINNAANAKRGMKYDTTNMKWFTNGVINYRGAECPEGFRPGKVNKSKPGGLDYHWYTNGKENVRAKECPQGFWKGRTISKA